MLRSRSISLPVLSTLAVVALSAVVSLPALAQAPGISVPPSGDNQRAAVTQHMGLATVTVSYSSPDVTGPNGEDRRGKIWGQLVPYGLAPNNFGTAREMPWRAGANENTAVEVSHDVLVEGKPLAAGRYGLHMIPGEERWTIIFSEDSTSWGSFFYEPAKDALRVEVEPEKAEFREWLSFDFRDRQRNSTVLALHWEELRVPVRFEVPSLTTLYTQTIERELRSSPGFNWQNWNAAAQFLLGENHDLERALEWSEQAITAPFVGQENFTTLSTKVQVLSALNRNSEAQETLARALRHPTAGPIQIHTVARQLQAQGKIQDAIEIFKLNAARHGETWPVHVGLARAYSAEGEFKKALEHAKKAYEQAPDPLNRGNLETVIGLLEQGKDFNRTN